ncbi:ectoine synthase [Amycolatopsis anabasis]|uniref:ectoine synthase n=1 Tax=Amycolatopsis anabasis TaxID=1840409 RepID=UPI00131AC9B6|nr:ectoine synthase [Amycolatopsis anabasis]
MIVKTLRDIEDTDADVVSDGWRSRRLLLAADGLGYSFHDTIMRAGVQTRMQYLNHVEAVYCIAGEAEVRNEATGESFVLRPGTLYVLDDHDDHTFLARTEVRNICIFTPACTGREVHDENGAYPPPPE